jgi:hypothetical protein
MDQKERQQPARKERKQRARIRNEELRATKASGAIGALLLVLGSINPIFDEIFGENAEPGVKAAVLIGILLAVAIITAADMIARALAAQGAARSEAPPLPPADSSQATHAAGEPTTQPDENGGSLRELVPLVAQVIEALQERGSTRQGTRAGNRSRASASSRGRQAGR